MKELGQFFLFDPFTDSVRHRIIDQQLHKCDKCGKKNSLQVHHIIPQVYKGKDEESNGVALCPEHHKEADFNVLELGLTYDGRYLNEMPDERFKGDVNPFKNIHIKETPESWRHDMLMVRVDRNTKGVYKEKLRKKNKKKKRKK